MAHLFQLVSHPFKNFHFAYLDLYTLAVLQVSQSQAYPLESEMVLHTLYGSHSLLVRDYLFELEQQLVYREGQTFYIR
jgi:hypothetical protein